MGRISFQDRIEQMVVEGFIGKRKHPTADLYIYNYTAQAEYGNVWTPETTLCRGLILDGAGHVKARGFRKFFNIGQPIGNGQIAMPDPSAVLVEATEKADGSMGVLYRDGERYAVATRGSFDSDQALWATDWLNRHVDNLHVIPPSMTLLFEIIYPANRIVVDYHGWEGLMLIGMIDYPSGVDFFWEPTMAMADILGLRCPQPYEFKTAQAALEAAKALDANQEGWVLRFSDDTRFKVKGDAYKLAHFLMTQVSFKRVLDAVIDDTYEQMIADVPDEFLTIVAGYRAEIAETSLATINRILELAHHAPKTEDRKEYALWVQANCPQADWPYLFAHRDGRNLFPMIYRMAFKERTADVQ